MSKTAKEQEPGLTFANLKKNNILIIDDDHYNRYKLPRHTAILRYVFLDDHDTIQARFKVTDDYESNEISTDPLWAGYLEEEREAVLKEIRGARHIKYEARRAQGKGEDAWSRFYFEHFFGPLEREFEARYDNNFGDKHARMVSRQNHFYDQFKTVGNDEWTLFDKNSGFRFQDRKGLTKPKPDLAFYFPILDTRDQRGITPEETDRQHSAQARLANNLSGNLAHGTLMALGKFGLQFTPRGIPKQGDLSNDNMRCFPWLIVEYKRDTADKREREKCYSQAANAGSAALMLFQTAARFAEFKVDNQHIPPVVTITAIGSAVHVWIVYYRRTKTGDRYEMKSIWSGDMTNVWNVLKFDTIVRNIHAWAVRTLKPLLSTYIVQWKSRFVDENEKYELSMGELEKQLETLESNDIGALVSLADVLDDATTKGFKAGREDALKYDHEEVMALRHEHISANETFLENLESAIDRKIHVRSRSTNVHGKTELENRLDDKIDRLQATLTTHLDNIVERKIDALTQSLTQTKFSAVGENHKDVAQPFPASQIGDRVKPNGVTNQHDCLDSVSDEAEKMKLAKSLDAKSPGEASSGPLKIQPGLTVLQPYEYSSKRRASLRSHTSNLSSMGQSD